MSEADNTLAELLLTGAELPPGTAVLQPVADLLSALGAAPATDELAGEGAALVVFRRQASARPLTCRRKTAVSSSLWSRSLHWVCSAQLPGPPGLAKSAGTKMALAVLIVVSLGGAAAAASLDALPSSIQGLAHQVMGAPSPGGSLSGSDALSEPAQARDHGSGGAAASRSGSKSGHGTGVACGSKAGASGRPPLASEDSVRMRGKPGRPARSCGQDTASPSPSGAVPGPEPLPVASATPAACTGKNCPGHRRPAPPTSSSSPSPSPTPSPTKTPKPCHHHKK